MEQMSFTRACLTYFGRKAGQTTSEFAAELKALTDKDRADLSGYFRVVGVEIVAAG